MSTIGVFIFLVLLYVAAMLDGKRTRQAQADKLKSYPKTHPICKQKKQSH